MTANFNWLLLFAWYFTYYVSPGYSNSGMEYHGPPVYIWKIVMKWIVHSKWQRDQIISKWWEPKFVLCQILNSFLWSFSSYFFHCPYSLPFHSVSPAPQILPLMPVSEEVDKHPLSPKKGPVTCFLGAKWSFVEFLDPFLVFSFI